MYRIINPTIYGRPQDYYGKNIVSGICPHCNESSGFKISGERSADTLPVQCNTCYKNVIWNYEEELVIPAAKLSSLKNLPEEVNRYYQEALSCIMIDAPNGAATLFRKLIHQVAIHYKVSQIDDRTSIPELINKLETEGHINKKLKESLNKIKELGNDGAHVKNNEPNMDQVYKVKDLIDSFLQATILADMNMGALDESRNSNNDKSK